MRPARPCLDVLDFIRQNGLALRIGWFVFMALAWACGIAWADDCAQDFTRLEDCLRTGGWAPAIAGTTTTVVTILVNGTEIIRTVTKNEGQDDEDVNWTFDVRTEEQRTTLVPDGKDMLWVYAKVTCSKPEKRADLVTRGIAFAVEGTHSNWVTLGRPQMQGAMKAVRLKAEPPSPDAKLTHPEFQVMVNAVIDGSAQSAPVNLKLDDQRYRVDLKFEEVWS